MNIYYSPATDSFFESYMYGVVSSIKDPSQDDIGFEHTHKFSGLLISRNEDNTYYKTYVPHPGEKSTYIWKCYYNTDYRFDDKEYKLIKEITFDKMKHKRIRKYLESNQWLLDMYQKEWHPFKDWRLDEQL